MPNPRLPETVKKRRGTFRQDRSDAAYDAETSARDEALTEYKAQAHAAWKCAVRREDVTGDLEYLRAAETALAAHGIVHDDGSPWRMSTLVSMAADAAQHDN